MQKNYVHSNNFHFEGLCSNNFLSNNFSSNNYLGTLDFNSLFFVLTVHHFRKSLKNGGVYYYVRTVRYFRFCVRHILRKNPNHKSYVICEKYFLLAQTFPLEIIHSVVIGKNYFVFNIQPDTENPELCIN